MYYPAMIQMNGKNVVVFGGGKVAYRKCKSILQCGGKVICFSNEFINEFSLLKKEYTNFVQLVEEEYKVEYLVNCHLVIAATNSKETNHNIYDNCNKRNILCNVVDNGEISDFILPSIVRRGDLVIAISTSGKSPSLSVKIKKQIEKIYTNEYEEYVHLLGIIREKILSQDRSEEEKKQILNGLVDKKLEELRKM